jgi:hypothetical protein
MKLQGWWDHRISFRDDFRAKESVDVNDIYALLDRAHVEKLSYDDEIDGHYEGFVDNACTLLRRFVSVYGGNKRWRYLGFPV